MTSASWNGWSDWTPITIIADTEVPIGPGAYIIAARKAVPRAIGIDAEGILTIGESERLRGRLLDFIRCASTKGETGHMAGWRYAFFGFDRYYPLRDLYVRWIATSSKETAYEEEGRLLLQYLRRHSELPPLNYKFNWSQFEKHGWDLLEKDAECSDTGY
jgi:hypothetical protein